MKNEETQNISRQVNDQKNDTHCQKLDVQINLFGAFRKYNSKPIHLQFAGPITSEQVKLALGKELQRHFPDFDTELIRLSVLADENSVLPSTVLIEKNCSLAVLPPVCGG